MVNMRLSSDDERCSISHCLRFRLTHIRCHIRDFANYFLMTYALKPASILANCCCALLNV
jgi:hypothetical protein